MTFEEFDKYSAELLADVVKMRNTKGREYAGPKDRFDNFNRLAARTNMPRNRVWQVYFTKHMDAIESYIQAGREFSDEGIRGRIVDAITYLTLLAGMIEEDQKLAKLISIAEQNNTVLQDNQLSGGLEAFLQCQHGVKSPRNNCRYCKEDANKSMAGPESPSKDTTLHNRIMKQNET